jgi:aspartate/methionine/tyrosine aminotransferase
LLPQGAFYAFANISKLGKTSLDLAHELLKNVQVVTIAGSAFGDAGEGYLRFSYVSSRKEIKDGVNRIKKYIERR